MLQFLFLLGKQFSSSNRSVELYVPKSMAITRLRVVVAERTGLKVENLLLHLWQPESNALPILIAKCSIITTWVGLLALRLNLAPEAVKLLAERFPGITRGKVPSGNH